MISLFFLTTCPDDFLYFLSDLSRLLFRCFSLLPSVETCLSSISKEDSSWDCICFASFLDTVSDIVCARAISPLKSPQEQERSAVDDRVSPALLSQSAFSRFIESCRNALARPLNSARPFSKALKSSGLADCLIESLEDEVLFELLVRNVDDDVAVFDESFDSLLAADFKAVLLDISTCSEDFFLDC